jgi:hypothetical protein
MHFYSVKKVHLNLKFYFMKKIIVMLVMLICVSGKSLLAATEENIPVTASALNTFKKEFPGAISAYWEKIEKTDIYLVRFAHDERGLLAYINEDGRLLAMARLVSMEQLPLNISRIIAKNYNDFLIEKIEELVTESSVSYLFSMNDKKVRIVLRVYSNGTFQKVKTQRIEE